MKLKQVNGNIIDLLEPLSEQDRGKVLAHFNDKSSYAKIVLDQINDGSIYKDISQTQDIVFDIGANIGLFSLFIAPISAAVFSFEPTQGHFELFKILTKPYSNILGVNSAIGTHNGQTEFQVNSQNSTMNRVGAGGINVSCLTLGMAEYLYGTPSFCKIDIEGFESRLLDYLWSPIGSFPETKELFLEVHGDFEHERNRWLNFLKEKNYVTKSLGVDGIFAKLSF